MTTVYLTVADTSPWTVPGDFSSTNTIEVIGGGGGGSAAIFNASNGAGGGGGAYSVVSNLTLSGTVAFHVGAAGAASTSGGDTWFNGASLAAASVGAHGGSGAIGTTGGAGGSTTGSPGTPVAGGNGGTPTNSGSGGSGGGGAGAPSGAGRAGGLGDVAADAYGGGGGGGAGAGSATIGNNSIAASGTGGAGGAGHTGTAGGAGGSGGASATAGTAGSAGSGGGGGGGTNTGTNAGAIGGAGGAGTEWDSTHGAGGGGGGGGTTFGGSTASGAGAVGGAYGGGGGGGAYQGGGVNFGVGGAGFAGIIVITYTPAGGAPDQIYPECADGFDAVRLGEAENYDSGPWDWYQDNASPNRANVEPPIPARLPEAFEWEDPNDADDALWQWPLAQAPPPADVDTNVYPQTIHDSSTQLEDVDEDFAFADAPLTVSVAPDQIQSDDASAQLEDADEDFAFADAPRPADIVIAAEIVQPQEPDQQPDEFEDYGFADAPLPEDILDQLFNEFGHFDDPADEYPDPGHFDAPRDVPSVADQIAVECSDAQGEPDEELPGFADAPLQEDDQGAQYLEQPEPDEDVEGFSDAPFEVPSDQVWPECADAQLADEDEDFGFAQDGIAPPDQIYVEDGAPLDELEDAEGFADAPRPDDVVDQVFTEDAAGQPLDEIDAPEGFSDAPMEVVVAADQIAVEDASTQLDEAEDAEGFSEQPLAADFVAPAVDLIAIEDASGQPADADEAEGFSEQPLTDDLIVDQGAIECADSQPEELEEDFGFADAPLGEDAPMLATESAEQAEPDEEVEGFADAPLADTVDTLSLIAPECADDQIDTPDDEAFDFSAGPLSDDAVAPTAVSGQHHAWLEFLARRHGLVAPLAMDASGSGQVNDGTLVQSVVGNAVSVVTTTLAGPSGAIGPSALTAQEALWLEQLVRIYGGIAPLTTTATGRSDGTVSQTFATAGTVTTVSTP